MDVSGSTGQSAYRPLEAQGTGKGWPVKDRLSPRWALDRWPNCLLLLAAIALLIYAPVLKDLVSDWWNDPDYTHGFLVPIVVACVLWTQRRRYAAIPLKPALSGLPIILAGLALRVAGTMAADYFTTRFSLCILLTGVVVYLAGWRMLRAMLFPLGYLVLMIPLPGILYNQLTFPMQLIASRIASQFIELIGIPVFREGNILHVPHFAVEVAQACSGIRSFFSLLALALGYSYFADRRPWIRFALVVVMIPIAILTNAVRVTASTLMGYWFGVQWAEGFTHLFSGWLIYLVSLALMFLAHALIKKAAGADTSRPVAHPAAGQLQPAAPSQPRVFVTAALVLGTALYLYGATGSLPVPSHRPLSELASQIGSFRGVELPLTQRIVDAAGMDDYVNRRYSDGAGNWLDLYIGYYRSQRTGDLIHSPRNCLPAGGWEQKRTGYAKVDIPGGAPLVVNDFLIVKGLERQVVLYWYQGRGRAVASEYESKLWMMSDALTRHRSDGALVRLAMHIPDNEAATRARAVKFVQDLYPRLNNFIPD